MRLAETVLRSLPEVIYLFPNPRNLIFENRKKGPKSGQNRDFFENLFFKKISKIFDHVKMARIHSAFDAS